MNPAEIIFGSLLVAALLGLAGYFSWRQTKTLERLRTQDLSPEDRFYVRKQVQRRLLCCVLMAVLGCMLVGWFFLDDQLRTDPVAEEKIEGKAPDDADRRNSLVFSTFYLIAFLLLLMVVLFLAAADLLATARFGHRQRRQLEAEHRAMLDSQKQRLRQERNGHH
jgi:hypothetical protein